MTLKQGDQMLLSSKNQISLLYVVQATNYTVLEELEQR